MRRQDEGFPEGLGTRRIPDPTTAGGATRRLSAVTVRILQEVVHRSRQRIRRPQPEGCPDETFIDVNGFMAATAGKCKGGIVLSSNGIWGYPPGW